MTLSSHGGLCATAGVRALGGIYLEHVRQAGEVGHTTYRSCRCGGMHGLTVEPKMAPAGSNDVINRGVARVARPTRRLPQNNNSEKPWGLVS